MITEGIVVDVAGGPLKWQKLELDDDLRQDEAHVRIKATGICQTDVVFAQESSMDMFPGVLGHEGAGIVQSIGSKVTAVQPGDHVIVVFSCCGECEYCDRKQTPYCDTWFQHNHGAGRADGSKAFRSAKTGRRVSSHFFGQSSFAQDIFVAQTALVKVPQEIPFEHLAPLGCGAMAGAGAMLNVIRPTNNMYVAVVGAGSVGLAAIMALNMLTKRPRRIIAVDVVPARLELARRFSATHCVNSKAHKNLMEVLLHITDGRGIDASIDTTGKAEVIQNLVHATTRRGKVIAVGTGGTNAQVSLNLFEMVTNGCSYIGCQHGDAYPQEFLPRLIEAQSDGQFPYDSLVKTYPAKEFAKAIQDMQSGRTIKPVLLWE